MDRTTPTTSSSASTPADAPGSGTGVRLPRRLAGGVVAVGALASCLTLAGQAASAAPHAHPTSVTAAAVATVAAPTDDQAVAAFYDAGYDYAEALDLAVLWGAPGVYDAKVTAGTKLLAHQALPFTPGHAPTSWTTEQDVDAFFLSGGSYQEALQLAVVWGAPSTYDAKATAGLELLTGGDWPDLAKTFTQQQDVDAFLLTGGDYLEGLQLAAVWGSPSVHDAKSVAGAKLLAGTQDDLPKIPEHFTKRQDVNAFRAAGYDRADARELARLWHTSTHAAKVTGGAKLLAGQTLPVQP